MVSKEPFEKIKSIVDKKNLFRQVSEDRAEVSIKAGDHDLIACFSDLSPEFSLRGLLSQPATISGDCQVLALFSIGDDRYFYNGTAVINEKKIELKFESELFKLQRRRTMRVKIPDFMKISANVTGINGKPIFVPVQIHDLSGGGIQFSFLEKKETLLKVGERVTGILHLMQAKTFPFEGTIRRHQVVSQENEKTENHFGLEFEKVNPKVTSLTLEIQRRLILGS